MQLKFDGIRYRIENTRYSTQPAMIHGNGPAKVRDKARDEFNNAVMSRLQWRLNALGNYLNGEYVPGQGCTVCDDHTFSLLDKEVSQVSRVHYF